jgi:hypothetical protein
VYKLVVNNLLEDSCYEEDVEAGLSEAGDATAENVPDELSRRSARGRSRRWPGSDPPGGGGRTPGGA